MEPRSLLPLSIVDGLISANYSHFQVPSILHCQSCCPTRILIVISDNTQSARRPSYSSASRCRYARESKSAMGVWSYVSALLTAVEFIMLMLYCADNRMICPSTRVIFLSSVSREFLMCRQAKDISLSEQAKWSLAVWLRPRRQ